MDLIVTIGATNRPKRVHVHTHTKDKKEKKKKAKKHCTPNTPKLEDNYFSDGFRPLVCICIHAYKPMHSQSQG